MSLLFLLRIGDLNRRREQPLYLSVQLNTMGSRSKNR